MQPLYSYAIVIIGAGVGGALRHWVNHCSVRAFGPDLPVATVVVNVVGSLALGLVAGHFATRGHPSQAVHLFLGTGLLGGFTTFSAFALEAALLWQRGQFLSCAMYALGTVVLSIASVFAGLGLVRLYHAV